MDLPVFLQGRLLGYSWIDAATNLAIYGFILYLADHVLIRSIIIPMIKNRFWFMFPYALLLLPLFQPQLRSYLRLWQALVLTTALAFLLYQIFISPIVKRENANKPPGGNNNGTHPDPIPSVNTEPIVLEKQKPLYSANHSINPLRHFHNPRDMKAFEQIVGMENAKGELRDAIELPLIYPDKIKQYDLKPASGLILYGPPGTGKTALARAAAAYFGAEFFLVNATSMVGQYVGTTEAAVKEIFQKARSKTPSIIFFDEIDAIGAKRDGRNLNRPSDIILNLLLTELDGFEKRKGVFVIAATNRIDILDDALLRPGRFDVKIEVPAPNEDERLALLKFFGKKKPLHPNVNLWAIAQQTEGLTGAYLEGLVNSAAKRALKRSLTSGWNERITNDDFRAVLPDIVQSN